MHKLQWEFANAFLDVFVTEGGRPKDPRVVDYYGEEEPIELGPDENMHDEMIEAIAELSVRRGYLLGSGIMSSKKVGINHKQYGVTSLGVVTFARDRNARAGHRHPQGPLHRQAHRGTERRRGRERAAPAPRPLPAVSREAHRRRDRGAVRSGGHRSRGAVAGIVLRADADAFDAARLSPGGFVLYRNARRTEGLRELYRRVEQTASGPREDWVTLDEFHKEFDGLLFEVPADLFIPAGGRPETIDEENWRRFLGPDGKPSARVIVEGANSFITPEARLRLQEAGAVVLRDASANKCGVISSSYEIIGNLLFSATEFLRAQGGVRPRRARDPGAARRGRGPPDLAPPPRGGGKRSFTEISDAISLEINANKARLFAFFQSRPDLAGRPALPQCAPRPPAAPCPRDARLARADRATAAQVPLRHPSGRDRRGHGLPARRSSRTSPAALEEYVSRMFH